MRATMSRWLKRGALALLVSAVGAAGATVVSAHGGDAGQIHGCANHSHGTLRIVGVSESCLPSESALDWNIQGPTGAAGPQGPTGARGPSDAYVTSLVTGTSLSSSHPFGTRVASLTLPAGEYIVSASVSVARGQAGASDPTCGLRVAGGPLDRGYGEHLTGADDRATIAISGVAPLTSGGVVAIDCDAIGDPGTSVQLADLTAVRVGALTRQ
jgi:hypothetical protein